MAPVKEKKLDLTKILKDCPKGAKFYSPAFGEVTFAGIGYNETYPIEMQECYKEPASFTKEGKYYDRKDAECMLFPSKDNRDWSTFKVEKPRPKFEPFQKVLVRENDQDPWKAQIFSHYRVGATFPHYCVGGPYKYCIPYEGNEALLGTANEPNAKK